MSKTYLSTEQLASDCRIPPRTIREQLKDIGPPRGGALHPPLRRPQDPLHLGDDRGGARKVRGPRPLDDPDGKRRGRPWLASACGRTPASCSRISAYRGVRCRELTELPDTKENRTKLRRLLAIIEQEIAADTFDYRRHFPNSRARGPLRRRRYADARGPRAARLGPATHDPPAPSGRTPLDAHVLRVLRDLVRARPRSRGVRATCSRSATSSTCT